MAALLHSGARAADVQRINYFDPENWLCRPDHNEACEGTLAVSVVDAKGKVAQRRLRPSHNPAIDCFYVYPTVSLEPTPLSDMVEGPEEKAIVAQQFMPFAAQCRLFAPLYRQLTAAAFAAEGLGETPKYDPEIPARDVVDAFRNYIAHDNAGRGFVLIGHSQGAAILKNLVAALVDRQPLAKQLLSVIIPGTNLAVPDGKDVGGSFAGIPLCRAAGQIGCAIVYSSYLATDPPGEYAAFGTVAQSGMRAACVNPISLYHGRATLDALLPTSLGDVRYTFNTPFLAAPGLLRAACRADGKHTWLDISLVQDRRTPKAARYLATADQPAGWGLHQLDINLALQNLVAVVGVQAKAWRAQH